MISDAAHLFNVNKIPLVEKDIETEGSNEARIRI